MPSRNTKAKSNKAKKFTKYKLLLDEGLPPSRRFSNLNELHNVNHIKHDYGFSAIADSKVYSIAEEKQNLVVVFNTKDFRPLIKPNKPSVISLSTNLTNKEADLKICKALKNLSTSQTRGCLISISKSGIAIKIP